MAPPGRSRRDGTARSRRDASDDGLVYSTDPEKMVRRDESAASPVLGDGRVRVRRESKGRKGKTVTTVTGLALDALALAELARDLKQACGAGGTVKDGVVELQGDRVDAVLRLLAQRGIEAKRAGG